MNYHDSLLNLFETYVRESEKFEKEICLLVQEQEKLWQRYQNLYNEKKRNTREEECQIVLKLYTVILIISL